MVRKAALLNMHNDPISDGDSHEMEVDFDLPNPGDKEAQTDLLELEGNMLEYGQALQSEYANDPRREVRKALDEIWSLVAYRNPLKESQVSHLLDRKGRVAVAEELNSAILRKFSHWTRLCIARQRYGLTHYV